MERLTEPEGSRCEGCQDAVECAYIAGKFPVPCPDAVRYERLKAYEDIGLKPEEIKDMAENAETRLLTWFESRYGFRVGELMRILEAEQDGRLLVLPKGYGGTCGGCGHFKRIPGKRRGTCAVRSNYTDRWGHIEERRGTFTPSQSRKCCRQYVPRKETKATLAEKGGDEE